MAGTNKKSTTNSFFYFGGASQSIAFGYVI